MFFKQQVQSTDVEKRDTEQIMAFFFFFFSPQWNKHGVFLLSCLEWEGHYTIEEQQEEESRPGEMMT